MIFTKLFACIAGIRVLATMTQAVPKVRKLHHSHQPTHSNLYLKSDAEPDLHTLMSTLPSNDDCFHHVGVDGVIRTFHTNGTVLDYVKLKPTHIVQLLKTYHGASDLAQVLTGVNGHDVTDEKQLFYPGIALLPAEFQRQEVTVGAGVVKERRDFGGELPLHYAHPSSPS